MYKPKNDVEIEVVESTPQKRKRRKQPERAPEHKITATKDEMSNIISDSVRWLSAPPVKTDEECAERVAEFFAYYAETGGMPTVEKLCLALGVARVTVWEWEHGVRGAVRANIIRRAKNVLASIDAELALTGKIPIVGYIFRSKVYYGLRENDDVAPVKDLFGEDTSREEIQRRLLEDTRSNAGEDTPNE